MLALVWFSPASIQCWQPQEHVEELNDQLLFDASQLALAYSTELSAATKRSHWHPHKLELKFGSATVHSVLFLVHSHWQASSLKVGVAGIKLQSACSRPHSQPQLLLLKTKFLLSASQFESAVAWSSFASTKRSHWHSHVSSLKFGASSRVQLA